MCWAKGVSRAQLQLSFSDVKTCCVWAVKNKKCVFLTTRKCRILIKLLDFYFKYFITKKFFFLFTMQNTHSLLFQRLNIQMILVETYGRRKCAEPMCKIDFNVEISQCPAVKDHTMVILGCRALLEMNKWVTIPLAWERLLKQWWKACAWTRASLTIMKNVTQLDILSRYIFNKMPCPCTVPS